MSRRTGLILSFIILMLFAARSDTRGLCGPAKHTGVVNNFYGYNWTVAGSPLCGLRDLSSYNSTRSYIDD